MKLCLCDINFPSAIVLGFSGVLGLSPDHILQNWELQHVGANHHCLRDLSKHKSTVVPTEIRSSQLFSRCCSGAHMTAIHSSCVECMMQRIQYDMSITHPTSSNFDDMCIYHTFEQFLALHMLECFHCKNCGCDCHRSHVCAHRPLLKARQSLTIGLLNG